jgi:methionyl aminopeptidase
MRNMTRNDLCWCGSGKKYKRCHLQSDLDQGKTRIRISPAPGVIVKSEAQIEGIRKSCKLAKKILDMVSEKIRVGITTNQIDIWVHEYTIEHHAIPAPLNYNGFPKSVCTSLNSVICHGIPDETVLKEGDIIISM